MRIPLAVSTAVLLALSAAPVRADEDAFPRKYDVRIVKDVPYYDGDAADKPKHQLDLYLPKDAKDYPMMLFLHGGSWRHGDKDDFSLGAFGVYSNFGSFYARRGIGVAVINYRLSPEVKHPEHIKDAARAFAWVRKHVGDYGGRTDQLFVAGHSAGGHLAALLATDDQWLKAEGLTPKAIKGVVCLSGVFNVPDDLLPEVFGDDAETHRQASPINHVHAGMPPFLLLCAEDDLPVCNQKCVDAFAKAVREKEGKVETEQIKDTDHAKIILHAAIPGDPATKAILKFLADQIVARLDAPAGPALQETFDVRYSDGPAGQALDVFAPKGAAGRPVVLFVHGGAWMFGDKNLFGYYRGVGRFFARHGAVAFNINYRLSPLVKHPEHVKDVARAFAWVRRHAGEYGGDPDRIFLCGHSSGGHLVALLATDDSYLKNPDLGLTDRDRAALKGVMAVCGVYRIPSQEEFNGMMGDMMDGLLQITNNAAPVAILAPMVAAHSRLLNPFRLVFGDDPAAAAKAAPLTHVRKGLPPFLVLYAERELPRLEAMATEFTGALRDAGDPVELRRITGCDHNFILFKLDRPGDPAAAALLDFLGKYDGEPARAAKP